MTGHELRSVAERRFDLDRWDQLRDVLHDLLPRKDVPPQFHDLRRAPAVTGALDQVAVDVVMGHTPSSNDMAAVYRQRVNDSRLAAVAEHVRNWLFPVAQKPA